MSQQFPGGFPNVQRLQQMAGGNQYGGGVPMQGPAPMAPPQMYHQPPPMAAQQAPMGAMMRPQGNMMGGAAPGLPTFDRGAAGLIGLPGRAQMMQPQGAMMGGAAPNTPNFSAPRQLVQPQQPQMMGPQAMPQPPSFSAPRQLFGVQQTGMGTASYPQQTVVSSPPPQPQQQMGTLQRGMGGPALSDSRTKRRLSLKEILGV